MEAIQIIDTSVLQNYSRAGSGSQPREFPGFGDGAGLNPAIPKPSFSELLLAPADIRRAAHSTRTGGHPDAFRLPIMGRERGKRGGEVRLAATWTGNRIAIMTNQLLEFGSTIFTNVFKDRHFYGLRPPGSFCTILAQRGGEWV
jgi:hypothetical protein